MARFWKTFSVWTVVALAPLARGTSFTSASAQVAVLVDSSATCDLSSGNSSATGPSNAPRVACGQASGNGSYSMQASANADFGTLRAFADNRLNNFSLPASVNLMQFVVTANATISDRITISAGGIWEVTVDVTGRTTAPPQEWCFSYGGGCAGSALGTSQLGSFTVDIPFRPGASFQIQPTLQIDLGTNWSSNFPNYPVTADSYVDLSHTMRFISSRVLDANGGVVEGAVVTSESGFNYADPAAAVPEPGTFACVTLAGLAVLAIHTRRRPTWAWHTGPNASQNRVHSAPDHCRSILHVLRQRIRGSGDGRLGTSKQG